LLDWLVETVNSRLPPGGSRGPAPTPFDREEIAAVLRMLVGYFTSNQQPFKDYLRSTNRPGYFKRGNLILRVTEDRYSAFASFWAIDAADVQHAFKLLSDGLQSVVTIPHQAGTIELALDESMIAWSKKTDPWVFWLPRKPKPLGMRAYLLASKLPYSGLPVVLNVFPDMFDIGCWTPTVCYACFGDSDAYSQSRLSGFVGPHEIVDHGDAREEAYFTTRHSDSRLALFQRQETTRSEARQRVHVHFSQKVDR
jgi:hypothetical protein